MLDDALYFLFCLVGFVLLCAALVAAIVFPARQFTHHYGVNDCRSFASQSGYESKFVDYSFWTWDCLVRDSSGRWVPVDKIRSTSIDE